MFAFLSPPLVACTLQGSTNAAATFDRSVMLASVVLLSLTRLGLRDARTSLGAFSQSLRALSLIGGYHWWRGGWNYQSNSHGLRISFRAV